MSEMIERVAHAIREEFNRVAKTSEPPLYDRLARAALAEAREPTKGQRISASQAGLDWDGETPLYIVYWRAMIDEALA